MMHCTTIPLLIITALHVWPSACQNMTVYEFELCYLNGFSCDELSCDSFPKRESCSCLHTCTLVGDCCYGVEEYNQRCRTFDAYLPINIEPHLGNLECVAPGKEYFTHSYLMVANCPVEWKESESCRGNGTQTYGRFKDGLAAIPVVSSKTGISYKNLFCAICNSESVDDLTMWNVLAECSHEQRAKFEDTPMLDQVSYVASECDNFNLAPPTNYIRQLSYFIPCNESSFENVTASCPQSDSNYKLCKDIYAPLVIDGEVFKNQYCADCHFSLSPDQKVSFLECEQQTENPTISRVFTWQNQNTFSPVSITLTFHQSEWMDEIRCSTGEIYDKLTQRCVRLNCPEGYYFNGKRCASIRSLNTTTCNYTHSTAIVRFANVSFTRCFVKFGDCWSKCLFQSLGLEREAVEYSVTSTGGDEAKRVVVVNFSISLEKLQHYENVWFKGDFKIVDNYKDCKHIDNIDIVASCQSFETHLCHSSWITSDQFSLYEGGPEPGNYGFLVRNKNIHNFSLSEVKIKHVIHFSKVFEKVRHNQFYQVASSHGYPCVNLNCETIIVNSSTFVPVANGSFTLVHVRDPTIILTPEQYRRTLNGEIEVCNFIQGVVYHTILYYIQRMFYVTGTSLSVLALSFCVLTYATFPQLRTSVSKVLTMVLCSNLLVASICFAMVNTATISQVWCSAVAWAIHFFHLSTFATSSIIAFHFIRTFRFKPRSSQTSRLTGSCIATNLAGCYGVPCMISLTLIFCHVSIRNSRLKYGDETNCLIGDAFVNLWVFTVPVGISVCFNSFAFVFVTLSIYFQTKGKKTLAKTQRKSEELKTFFVFFKISSLLGLTWLIGFLGFLTNQRFLLFIFDILTPFQGFLIFISFMCKKKTWKLWKQQLKGKVRPQNANSTSKAVSRTSPLTLRTVSGRAATTVSQL